MQVRFRGVTASDERSAGLLVTELDLGDTSVRGADHDNLGWHGTSPGIDYVNSNTVKFALWSNRKTYSQGVGELNAFMKAWREPQYSDTAPTLYPLDFRHDNDGPWQTIFGVPDVSSNSQIDEVAHHGFSIAEFEFRQLLPLVYGPERSETLTDGSYINFLLSEAPVTPVISLHGPFTNPVVTIGGTRLGLRGTATANQIWTVDLLSRKITDNYGRNISVRTDRQTILSRVAYAPEGQYVELSGISSIGLKWRPAAFNRFEGGVMVEHRWTGEPVKSPSLRLENGRPVAWNPLSGSDLTVKRIWRQIPPPSSGTSYEWEDEPNESPSVKKRDGQVVARNMAYGAPTTVTNIAFDTPYDNSDLNSVTYDGTGSTYVGYASGMFQVSPGDFFASALSFDWGEGDIGRVRLQVQFRGPNNESISAPQVTVDKTDYPGGGRISEAYLVPEGSWEARVYSWFYLDGAFILPTTGSKVSVGKFSVGSADSEQAALDQVATYFDGDSVDDRAGELWYNSIGIPHVWIKGSGWVEYGDPGLQPVPEGFMTIPVSYDFDGDTPDYIIREDK